MTVFTQRSLGKALQLLGYALMLSYLVFALPLLSEITGWGGAGELVQNGADVSFRMYGVSIGDAGFKLYFVAVLFGIVWAKLGLLLASVGGSVIDDADAELGAIIKKPDS